MRTQPMDVAPTVAAGKLRLPERRHRVQPCSAREGVVLRLIPYRWTAAVAEPRGADCANWLYGVARAVGLDLGFGGAVPVAHPSLAR